MPGSSSMMSRCGFILRDEAHRLQRVRGVSDQSEVLVGCDDGLQSKPEELIPADDRDGNEGRARSSFVGQSVLESVALAR